MEKIVMIYAIVGDCKGECINIKNNQNLKLQNKENMNMSENNQDENEDDM